METLEERAAALRELLPGCRVRDRLRIAGRLERLFPPRDRTRVGAQLERLLEDASASAAAVAKRAAALPEVTYPQALPITARRDEIVGLIREHPVVVVAGETGSGKTTQLPKLCLEAGLGRAGRIGCTQPRRVAALSVSRRIAEELGVDWGREVGCQIRFTDRTSEATVIKMMTDGILLNEVQFDPLLHDYDAVILDEAHERSLNIDFLLGVLKQLRARRPDLKLIITSATIDTAAFAAAFGGAPVVEVSGRTYPVDVLHMPVDEALEEAGEMTYIDAAVQAVEDLVEGYGEGDVLVFMPGERDIRETVDLLAGRRLPGAEIMPLFGRLTAGDQSRIFSQVRGRKIVVATNIAETSITIPGIRFVVDTGLARISRYSPHTRTLRLPVEKISQSSADQRKGRCGRVREGICVRLYAEADYRDRPRYSQPEILRCNLASVILRMVAFKIGEVETFPFLEPPNPKAIAAGYRLLQDLGALDEQRALTPLGRELARLPVDPTVGRMLLQAREENAVREVLVIAAGLSIQDPRERPLEKREAADQAHKRFAHPESDFLTLVQIWATFHDECERLSQGQLRRFCRDHFLSYVRMREWRDLHGQLAAVLRELDGFRANAEPASYEAVHRSILSGLIGNLAHREAGNHYEATHARKVMLFPGSGLFDKKAERPAKKKRTARGDGASPPKPEPARTPEWVMAGEWMETGRLYARSVAKIEPAWAVALGGHLVKRLLGKPFWDAKKCQVVARERLRIYGLEVSAGNVPYRDIDPAAATDLFIREGLVEDTLKESLPFLHHNRELRREVELWQTRLRRASAWGLDERAAAFYTRHLEGEAVGSVGDLQRVLKEKGGAPSRFLFMDRADLLGEAAGGDEAGGAAYPDSIDLGGGERLAVSYAYRPGEDEDGVTLKVPLEQLGAVQSGMLDWLVPAHLEEKINALLRGLPKAVRRELLPIAERAREAAEALAGERSLRPLPEVLREFIAERYNVRTRPDDWQPDAVPEHLRPRVEVVGGDIAEGAKATGKGKGKAKGKGQRPFAVGRDLASVAREAERRLRSAASNATGPGGGSGSGASQGRSASTASAEAAARWERYELTAWSFGDLPESVPVGEVSGVPVPAFPGLEADPGEGKASASVRLFADRAAALAATRGGFRRLGEYALGKEFAWLRKDLRDLSTRAGPLFSTLGDSKQLRADAYEHLADWLLLDGTELLPLRHAVFEKTLERARTRLQGLVPRFVDQVVELLEARQRALTHPAGHPTLRADADALLGARFLRDTPHPRLPDLGRYFQALLLRAERFRHSPQKDTEKAARVKPYTEALAAFQNDPPIKRQRRAAAVDELRWMVEEYKVSVFAQELGTAMKVSPKKLEAQIEAVRTQ